MWRPTRPASAKRFIQLSLGMILLTALAFAFVNSRDNADCTPAVTAGVLDLSCWDRATPIRLRGHWRFEWAPLDATSRFDEQRGTIPQTFSVPGRWADVWDHVIPPTGTGTYSAAFAATGPIVDLALLPGRGLTDYRVELIDPGGLARAVYSNRTVTGVEVIPSDPILLPAIESGSTLRLIVRNRNYYSGGMDVAPMIGAVDRVIRYNNIRYTVAAILLGGYTFFGIYNLVLWLGYRRDRAFFLLAMCCLTLAARVLDTEDLLPVFWREAPVAIFADIGWGTYFSLALWWPLYFLMRFPTRAFRVWASIYSGMALIGLLLVFSTSSTVFMEYGIKWFRPMNIIGTMVLMGMFIWHSHKDEQRSLIEPLSGVLVALATCIDIYLYIIDQRPFIDTSNVAFFIFISGQSFTVARGYSASLEKQRSLSKDLIELNESLEGRVQDRTRDLEIVNEKLRDISLRDDLTGLFNRRAFNERLQEEVNRCARYQQPMCLLVIDIDHFKQVNDTFGHGAGDAVLVGIATALRRMARESDIVARFGGEEFVLIVPGASLTDASRFAERVREAVRDTEVECEGNALSVSVSIGVAEHDGGQPLRELFRRADEALYQAKNAGRDRVECYRPS